MLRTVPGPLAARLAGETTLARIWRITRRDGQVFGFTDHDRDLVVGGRTYLAVNAADSSQVAGSAEFTAGAGEISIAAGGAIAAADVEAGLWSLATIDMELVDWADPGAGVVALDSGELGTVALAGGRITVELRGFKHRLGKPVGETVQPTCQADLGDARCGVNLAPFTVTGSVTSVVDSQQFTDGARAEATAFFDGGLLTFTSGANSGRGMEVKRFTAGGAFVLFLPLAYSVAVGDTYSLRPGCAKTVADCVGKYGNLVNFRGFPFVPGNQALRNGGTA